MATVSYHQAKAARFLKHAQDNIARRDHRRAAQAIARAASHAATALAVHRQTRHNSPRQLRWAIHGYVFDELGHGHLKTFREACDLPRRISSRPATDADRRRLLRLRRRANSFVKAVDAIVAGEPLPIHQTRRSIRKPDEPAAPHFATVRDITTLPNYLEIRNRFRLNDDFAAKTDPHGWYQSGRDPRPFPCHPRPRNASKNPDYIILSPLWRRALEKTFHVKLPDPLYLHA
ncbi:MAG: hypothetical protein F4W95_02080 [Chloroflexi bacterium]|nr:hypothetical protein [Chloroflexota bacterium]MYD47254.1 hypothetical protein [Chloroflexota bacterium]